MAEIYGIFADVTAVAQVDTFTPANVEVDDVFTLTATGEDGTTATVSFTATVATVANVAAGLMAAWNASTHRHCTPITASGGVTAVVLTADTAGVPFSVASSTTDGGGANTQTLTRAATTANVGKNDWNYAGNWSTNTVPTSSDNVTLDGRMQNSALYGLGQSGVTLAVFRHFLGAKQVGSATGELRISVTAGDINKPPEDGSSPAAQFFRLATGSNQTTLNIWTSGASAPGVGGQLPVVWKGAHNSNVVNVFGGTLGIGTAMAGDAATVATLNVIGKTAKAVVGSGVTLTTVNCETGGKAVVRCAFTTANVKDGDTELTTEGSGAATTINGNGKLTLNSTGTITTLKVQGNGSFNTRQTNNERTISACLLYGNGTGTTDLNTSFTTGIDFLEGAKGSQVDFGDTVTLTPSAV